MVFITMASLCTSLLQRNIIPDYNYQIEKGSSFLQLHANHFIEFRKQNFELFETDSLVVLKPSKLSEIMPV